MTVTQATEYVSRTVSCAADSTTAEGAWRFVVCSADSAERRWEPSMEVTDHTTAVPVDTATLRPRWEGERRVL
ncbi:hypothetical protein D3C83_163400 [compost metagenome]